MDQPLKIVLASAALLLIGGVCGRSCNSPSEIPSGLEGGALLNGLQLQGAEKPINLTGGMEVLEVSGSWVHLRLTPDEKNDRWINFEWVTSWSEK